MKNRKLRDLLTRVNPDFSKTQKNDELTILSNELTNAIRGGWSNETSALDPCTTKCKPNSCGSNNSD